MTITYVMETAENYDPTWVVAMDTTGVRPAVYGLQNKLSTGVRYDPVRRKLLYCIAILDSFSQTNTTGFVLWDGSYIIDIGDSYDADSMFTQWIVEKDIDTGAVTFHQCYNSTKMVPTGIGPTAMGNFGFVTNPAPGDNIVINGITWTFVVSGAAGPQTNIQATQLDTITQLAWDLNASTDPALTSAYYFAGDIAPDVPPDGTTGLLITYKTGGVAGNSYTLDVGTSSATISGATLAGGDTSSDGTWRRYVDANYDGNGNNPMIVDPRTGNVWHHTDSFNLGCAIYLFRRSENFSQIISPYIPPGGQSYHMEMIGISNNWTYVRLVRNSSSRHFKYVLSLTPRDITSEETTLDALVAYAEFNYDPLWDNYYFRSAFNHSTSMFTYGGTQSGTRDFILYRFDEPSAAPFGGPIVGGGFTDITPWGPSTGPNSNVAAYTHNGLSATPSTYGFNKYSLYYLPVTDELVCINKLWAGDTTTGWSDPTLTRFDCTYVNISGGTFDYHEGFVTGYMKSDWTTTTDPMQAAWVLLNVREVDTYLDENTYAFAGVDYTKRWFYFDVQPVVAGAWSYDATKFYTVMVQYQFVSGSAPLVVQVIDESGWDAAYGAYATSIGNTNVVYNSIGTFNATVETFGEKLGEAGIFIPDQSAFYWDANDDPTQENVCYLTPAYLTNRKGYINSGNVTGPFLKLSFSSIPLAVGRRWEALIGPLRVHFPNPDVFNLRVTETGDQRITMAGDDRITQ